MTGIESIGWPSSPRIANRTTSKPSFFVPTQAEGAGQAAAAAAPEPAAAGSMLALQELGTGAAADREARRHGQDMLAALAMLQRALLKGQDDERSLQRLADLAAAVPLAADNRLAAVVSAIVLRIRVELARQRDPRFSIS